MVVFIDYAKRALEQSKKMLVCRAPTYPPKTDPTQKIIAFLRIFIFFFTFL